MTGCYDSKSRETVEELTISEQGERSPSKSTTTESQVTVRSSPLVPEAVPVCRQCHKNCLSNVLANKAASQNHTDCFSSQETNDWQGIVLLGNQLNYLTKLTTPRIPLGLCGNPVANLVNYDPFKTPEISLAPPTPDKSEEEPKKCTENHTCRCQQKSVNQMADMKSSDVSPDESPETEDHPYLSLNSSVQTLRRFGTVSSLERWGSEEKDDAKDVCENHYSSDGKLCLKIKRRIYVYTDDQSCQSSQSDVSTLPFTS